MKRLILTILFINLCFIFSYQSTYSQDGGEFDDLGSDIDVDNIDVEAATKDVDKNKKTEQNVIVPEKHELDKYFEDFINGKKGVRYTIDGTIDYIVKNSPEIKEAEWGIKYYKGLYTQAQGGAGPKLYLQSFIAPTPEIKGNTEKSEIVDFWNFKQWGYYYRADATVIQPVYTFDRLSSAKEAATKGIEAAKAERDNVKWQVVNRAKELYYGHLMVLTLYNKTLSLVESILNESITFAKDAFDKGEGNIKSWDINKLEVAKAELERNKAEAMKFIIFTQNALKKFLKLKDTELFVPADADIQPMEISIHPYEYYEKLAFQNNALWRMVNAGVDAYGALVDLEVANYFPIVGIAGQFGFGYANQIDDQDSSFAYDPYNEIWGGVGVGILWYFDVWSQSGIVDQREAEHQKIIQKKDFARDGICVLLKEAYLDVLMYKRNIKTDNDGMIAAESWLKNAIIPWKTGLAEAKDALEGLGALAMSQKNYYMSIFQYNMAIAKLSYLCGTELGKYKYGQGKSEPVTVK